MVLHGLGMFNIEKIKEEYETFPDQLKEFASKVRHELSLEWNSVDNYIGHKDYINIVKDQAGQGNTWGADVEPVNVGSNHIELRPAGTYTWGDKS